MRFPKNGYLSLHTATEIMHDSRMYNVFLNTFITYFNEAGLRFFMSGIILLDEKVDSGQKITLAEIDSEIFVYSLNLRLASNSELHQDLLFYQIKLDSLQNAKSEDSDDKKTQEIDLEMAETARIISAKIRAVETEMERRKRNSG